MKPTKKEITEYMNLHNTDEIGLNNKWTFEDAEYYLLLSDKYYYKNKARCEFEQLLNDDEDFKIQWGFKDTYKEIDFLEWFKDVYIKGGGLNGL